MADEKIIFSMNGVGKVLPQNNRVILKDIYLSFFYGAKIGIIGLNGSGKSTLMKIIAGIEKQYQGEVVWAPGYSVGYLEQEPRMDPDKTVLEVVQEGVQEVMDVLKEYEEVNLKFCEPMSDDEMTALIERQGELTEKIDHLGGWEIDAKLERAMDALQCPPSDALVAIFQGARGVGSRFAVFFFSSLTCCFSMSLPTISTRSQSSGWKSTSVSTRGRS